MLVALSIRQVVLIDTLDLSFESGLGVFTGETGAGKSILLDALSLALGARADSSLVRKGAAEAAVVAVFNVSLGHPVGALLTGAGIDFAGELILKRTLSKDGKSRAFVNNEPVSASFLKTVGESLAEIHGQFASHQLLNPATHLKTLDAYGALGEMSADTRRLHQAWQSQKARRGEAECRLMRARQEEEFLKGSVAALERLNPLPDEEEKLAEKRAALMNSEKIITALDGAFRLLSDEPVGGMALVAQALGHMRRANQMAGGALDAAEQALEQAEERLGEVMEQVESAQEKWADVSELPALDERLFDLKEQARRHQVPIAELPALCQKLKEQLAQAEQGDALLIELQKEEERLRLEYLARAEKLSAARRHAAKRLAEGVARELPALKLAKAAFVVEQEPLPEQSWSETGTDHVVFMISTNAGLPPAPIHKIASGGELARLMLAVKVNLARTEQTETLVFDEVDTGIGGAAADAVGERLRRLAQERQVLVVTHAPQVAAYAAHHYHVSKSDSSGATLVQVQALDGSGRRAEIARMLSGAHVTETAQKMARELLEKNA